MSILPGPVNALYGETIAGAAVIRAFGMQSVFVQSQSGDGGLVFHDQTLILADLIKTTNMHQSCYIMALSMGRWAISTWQIHSSSLTSVRANILNVIIVSATLALIITTPGMTGSQAGFILGFASRVVSDLHDVLFNLREYDLNGVKLERLAEYRNLDTEDIPGLIESQEMADATDDPVVTALSNWPSKGAIQVTDLAARYAPDMPEILHDVSFSCDGGERVGIVGASGGGKSTLAKALFSFVEVTNGKIEIDDKGTFIECTPLMPQILQTSHWVSYDPGWVSSPKTRCSSAVLYGSTWI